MDESLDTTENLSIEDISEGQDEDIPGLQEFLDYLLFARNAAEKKEIFLMRVYLNKSSEIIETFNLDLNEYVPYLNEVAISGYQEIIPDYLNQLMDRAEKRDEIGFNITKGHLLLAFNHLKEINSFPKGLLQWEQRFIEAQQKFETRLKTKQKLSYLDLTLLEASASNPLAYLYMKYQSHCKKAYFNSKEKDGQASMIVNLAYARRVRRIIDEQFNEKVGLKFEDLCERLKANHEKEFGE